MAEVDYYLLMGNVNQDEYKQRFNGLIKHLREVNDTTAVIISVSHKIINKKLFEELTKDIKYYIIKEETSNNTLEGLHRSFKILDHIYRGHTLQSYPDKGTLSIKDVYIVSSDYQMERIRYICRSNKVMDNVDMQLYYLAIQVILSPELYRKKIQAEIAILSLYNNKNNTSIKYSPMAVECPNNIIQSTSN